MRYDENHYGDAIERDELDELDELEESEEETVHVEWSGYI